MLHVYTSYFSKMAERLKDEDHDIYVQVSRSVFCPKVSKSGKRVDTEIDCNFGDWLGMWDENLQSYYDNLDAEDMAWLKEWLDGLASDEDEEINVFLLCHENLLRPYAHDNKYVKEGMVKEGAYPKCHRRMIAKYMMDKFGMYISEYGVEDGNPIVYRDYLKE